jgi:hypothetical protein
MGDPENFVKLECNFEVCPKNVGMLRTTFNSNLLGSQKMMTSSE